jgi:NAD(P)-dependent dehydrogenase (short-subunit alcohol dehydrogenase family)
VDLGIDGRVAFVAGADHGVGQACARALVAEGVQLVSAPAACDIVVAHGDRQKPSSVLDPAALEELRAAWDSVVEAVESYRAALPAMEARRWGRLIWIGSAQAKSIDGNGDEFDAIRSLAVMGLHKVVTAEEAPHNVTANTVLRGGDASDDDIAATVTFLCSEGAAYLSGTTIVVDGGAGSAVF